MTFTCVVVPSQKERMEGNRSSNRLLGLSSFATVIRLSYFDLQPMEEDSSLPPLKGQLLIFQGRRGRQRILLTRA
jgi:hypothetical protein